MIQFREIEEGVKMKVCKKILVRILIFFFLAVTLLVTLGPFLWVLFASFQTNKEILDFTLGFPSGVQIKNYTTAFQLAPIVRYYFNSIFITFFGVTINLIAMGMAAYVLSRFQFRGQNLIRLLFSMGLLIPGAALLLPLYTSVSAVGLYDSMWGLIIVYVGFGIPQSLFIISSYYKTIPKEMEESAYLDGAGFVRTYITIIMPLARPSFATAGVMQFLLCWNEFQFALTLTTGDRSRTLPIALYYFKSSFASDYGAMFAAIVLVSLPSIIVYIILQKYVVTGMVAGAVKG